MSLFLIRSTLRRGWAVGLAVGAGIARDRRGVRVARRRGSGAAADHRAAAGGAGTGRRRGAGRAGSAHALERVPRPSRRRVRPRGVRPQAGIPDLARGDGVQPGHDRVVGGDLRRGGGRRRGHVGRGRGAARGGRRARQRDLGDRARKRWSRSSAARRGRGRSGRRHGRGRGPSSASAAPWPTAPWHDRERAVRHERGQAPFGAAEDAARPYSPSRLVALVVFSEVYALCGWWPLATWRLAGGQPSPTDDERLWRGRECWDL